MIVSVNQTFESHLYINLGLSNMENGLTISLLTENEIHYIDLVLCTDDRNLLILKCIAHFLLFLNIYI